MELVPAGVPQWRVSLHDGHMTESDGRCHCKRISIGRRRTHLRIQVLIEQPHAGAADHHCLPPDAADEVSDYRLPWSQPSIVCGRRVKGLLLLAVIALCRVFYCPQGSAGGASS